MRISVLAILILFTPQDSADQYFKFKKGTCWTYESKERDKTKKAVFIVTKEEKDKVFVTMEEYDEGATEPTNEQSFAWWVKDGMLTFGSADEEGGLPPLPVFKLGSKKGDTWKVEAGEGERKTEMTASHEGTMELKVPAGTYKDVLHTTVKIGEEVTIDFYLAPKVGLIKISAGDEFNAELKEMGERKEVDQEAANRSKNERNASGSLKTIATAEADFRSNDRDNNRMNDFWTADVSGLYRLLDGSKNPNKLIELATAEADAAPVDLDLLAKNTTDKPKPKSGYHFRALVLDENGNAYAQDTDGSGKKCRNTSRFAYCAYPSDYPKTGKKTYLINEGNTVFWKDTGGKPVENWPKDEELEKDWKKLD